MSSLTLQQELEAASAFPRTFLSPGALVKAYDKVGMIQEPVILPTGEVGYDLWFQDTSSPKQEFSIPSAGPVPLSKIELLSEEETKPYRDDMKFLPVGATVEILSHPNRPVGVIIRPSETHPLVMWGNAEKRLRRCEVVAAYRSSIPPIPGSRFAMQNEYNLRPKTRFHFDKLGGKEGQKLYRSYRMQVLVDTEDSKIREWFDEVDTLLQKEIESENLLWVNTHVYWSCGWNTGFPENLNGDSGSFLVSVTAAKVLI